MIPFSKYFSCLTSAHTNALQQDQEEDLIWWDQGHSSEEPGIPLRRGYPRRTLWPTQLCVQIHAWIFGRTRKYHLFLIQCANSLIDYETYIHIPILGPLQYKGPEHACQQCQTSQHEACWGKSYRVRCNTCKSFISSNQTTLTFDQARFSICSQNKFIELDGMFKMSDFYYRIAAFIADDFDNGWSSALYAHYNK